MVGLIIFFYEKAECVSRLGRFDKDSLERCITYCVGGSSGWAISWSD